jgi:hypothetical protein
MNSFPSQSPLGNNTENLIERKHVDTILIFGTGKKK